MLWLKKSFTVVLHSFSLLHFFWTQFYDNPWVLEKWAW
jgi:hypothetical protein